MVATILLGEYFTNQEERDALVGIINRTEDIHVWPMCKPYQRLQWRWEMLDCAGLKQVYEKEETDNQSIYSYPIKDTSVSTTIGRECADAGKLDPSSAVNKSLTSNQPIPQSRSSILDT